MYPTSSPLYDDQLPRQAQEQLDSHDVKSKRIITGRFVSNSETTILGRLDGERRNACSSASARSSVGGRSSIGSRGSILCCLCGMTIIPFAEIAPFLSEFTTTPDTRARTTFEKIHPLVHL